MANAMPSKRMTMGRASGVTAAKRGPNPDDLTQGRMQVPGPARFAGTVSSSKGPASQGTGPNKFFLPDKPISTQKGQPAKKT